MHRSDDFSLFTISDVPYLLPFGQGIADLKRGVQINDTGIYLWELLGKDRTEEEILSLCAAHYEIPDSRLQQLKADLQQFLHMLDKYGMLKQPEISTDLNAVSDFCAASGNNTSTYFDSSLSSEPKLADRKNIPVCADTVQRYLSIGGLTILLRGPVEAFSQDFDSFEFFPDSDTVPVDPDGKNFSTSATMAENTLRIDQTVTITDCAPSQCPKGKILLKNRELTVTENDSQYFFFFPAAPGICEAHLTKDGNDARYYCCPPYTDSFRQDLFHAIRLSFLYLAQLHDMVVLHSASLLYRGKAWLFSGHSGAGKSTHTNLWREIYTVPLINGDLNLLSIKNGIPMVHGLPWCGTSGIVDTHSYPLGGILLIKKALQNRTVLLDDSHAQLLVAQRLISPSWTENLMRKNLCIVAQLAPHILVCRLYCTKTPEAVAEGKKIIDEYLLATLH